MGSFIVELVLFGMNIDSLDLSFPIALISLPVNETIILGVTLLFARYKGASLKELGLKKARFRILAIVSVFAVPLFLLATSIGVVEIIVFGSDPMAKLAEKLLAPRDSFQLVAIIAFSLVLVGPCEEIAFRGFIQKGFESSFGKMRGLLLGLFYLGFCMVLILCMRLFRSLLLVWFLVMCGNGLVGILPLRL